MLFVALILYVLGVVLMLDNIRAQPHEHMGKPGYGLILLFIVWIWPFAVATDLVHSWIAPLFKNKTGPD